MTEFDSEAIKNALKDKSLRKLIMREMGARGGRASKGVVTEGRLRAIKKATANRWPGRTNADEARELGISRQAICSRKKREALGVGGAAALEPPRRPRLHGGTPLLGISRLARG